ncbi:MAG: LamB/YcsF family protein [Desulfitobacteriaceae bacterium]
MKTIDINCDMGESFGVYKIATDEAVMNFISSANIACGFHAGDPMVMRKTVKLALENGVGLGAHPGFPDLAGFGRREMNLSLDEIETYVIYQVGALMGMARSEGGTLQHVKPHGMLYNMAVKDNRLAEAIARAIAKVDSNLILVALASSEFAEAGKKVGLKVANEVFADRGYNADGSLVARGTPGAFIKDPKIAAQRVVRMVKEGKVEAIDGTVISFQADTVCLHGDNPDVVTFVKTISQALEAEGIKLTPLGQTIGKLGR